MFECIEEAFFSQVSSLFVSDQNFQNEQVSLSHQSLLLNRKDASGNLIIAIIMSNFAIMIDSSLLVLEAGVVMESQSLQQKWNSLQCLWSAFTIKCQHQTL